MAAPALPDDILHLLCEEIANQEQFDTLFNCACASRALAIPALTNLYRFHHLAPVRGGGEDEAIPLSTKLLVVQKWSILWKSIIESSLDLTLFPYCRYIKTLDFRDLGYLLDDDQFKVKISKQFFSGALSQFHMTETRINIKGRKHTRLKVPEIIDAIGEVVTQHTPTLESISGELISGALVRWAPRLPRLQSLELWDGTPLADELVHASIYEHCPHFNSLMIFSWMAEDRDHKFSKFIASMRPNSLRTLHTLSDIGAGAETFLALNHHGDALNDLRISVSNDTLPHISLLQGCTSLETLRIDDIHGTMDLETSQHDVFLETIAWLRKCENLQGLHFTKLQSAVSIVTPLLLEEKIKLRSLDIDSYTLKDNRAFHQALIHQQPTLRFLSLSGETDGMFRDDLDILVDSLKGLTELRELRLLLQEVFRDEHLISIVENLSLLEDLYVSGLLLTDSILEVVGNLGNLRSLTLAGISKFTTDGLLEFISRLGPGNQGLRVMIDMADPDTLLPDDQVALIRESLVEKVGGSLKYTPWRDPNISEFEGESD